MNKNKTLSQFALVFFFCSIVFINNVQSQTPEKNWGIRLGLNAVSIKSFDAYYADEIIPDCSYKNKNGYFLTGFARFNFNRIFLQPEIAWNEYRRSCSFYSPVGNSDSYYPDIDLDIDSKAFNATFLAGYNIVHDYPFLFGVFFGTSFAGTYRTDYTMESRNSFSKTGFFLNYSGILGFSINISKIYFDLRYEMCLTDNNKKLKDIPDFPENYQNISFKYTEAILSFSFGVMF